MEFQEYSFVSSKKKLKVYIFIRFNIYSQLTKRAFLWYQVHRLMTILRQQIILWINLLNAYCISLFLYFLIFQNKFFEMLYYFFWNIIHWVENIRHCKRIKSLCLHTNFATLYFLLYLRILYNSCMVMLAFLASHCVHCELYSTFY